MNIFITGASGFIGGNFLTKLLQLGHNVTAVSHTSKILLDCDHPNLRIVSGSLNDDFSIYLKEIDYLIHMASYGVVRGSNQWENCFDVNVTQYLKFLLTAIESGVKQYLVFGSCFEYGRSGELHSKIPINAVCLPTTAYSASKSAATSLSYALAIQHQLKMIIVRPFHVYGEGENSNRFWPSLVSAARNGENFLMTEGEQVRDFQHVDATINQILNLMNVLDVKDGIPVLANLGTSNPQKLIDFAKSTWESCNAEGSLVPGAIPYRENEVMCYTPKVEYSDFSF